MSVRRASASPRSSWLLVGAALSLALLPGRAAGQFPPDSLENLKYFPKDIEVRALIGQMRDIATSLGARCSYCHVGEEGQPLSEYDFPSDDKIEKRKARQMLRIRDEINTELLADLPERSTPPVEVTCATCHHGKTRPVSLEYVLDRAREEGGGRAAVARYRELREASYGSYAYNFVAWTLEELAVQWAAQDWNEDAVAILELNREFYPESSRTYYYLGQLYDQLGDRDQAIRNLERAVELQPENQRYQGMLERIRGGA